jgi:hypothetical protein
MTMRCDHCRGELGRSVRRYWQMRFCSSACIEAYQLRLDEATKAKIERLDFVCAPEVCASDNAMTAAWRRFGAMIRPAQG